MIHVSLERGFTRTDVRALCSISDPPVTGSRDKPFLRRERVNVGVL